MNAHDARSSGDGRRVDGGAAFSAGSDSPVSTASSHSSASVSQQAQVGGHDVADREHDDVARDDLGHVDVDRR